MKRLLLLMLMIGGLIPQQTQAVPLKSDIDLLINRVEGLKRVIVYLTYLMRKTKKTYLYNETHSDKSNLTSFLSTRTGEARFC